MKKVIVIVYEGIYIYDGENFYRTDEYSFDKDTTYLVYDYKKFLHVCKERNVDVIDLILLDTTKKLDLSNIEEYKRILHIFKYQKQNITHSFDYIPKSIIQKYLIKLHNLVTKTFDIHSLDLLSKNSIRFHSLVCQALYDIEKNKIRIKENEINKKSILLDFHPFGTFTGRITHELVQLHNRRSIIDEKNIYEYDFKSFEVVNILNYCGYKIDDEDVYNIPSKFLSRKQIKDVFISYIYGSSIENICKSFNNNVDVEVKSIIFSIRKTYQNLFNFKDEFLNDVSNKLYFITPISGIKISYENGIDVRRRSFNNFVQSLSADILKTKLILLNSYIKKHNLSSKILFPVYDSFYIKTENEIEKEQMKQLLESNLIINNKLYTNRIVVS